MSFDLAYKRCRPALGTFAEVVLQAGGPPRHARAGEAAFDAMVDVEMSMSFHAPCSDLTRLNAAPPGVWVPLPPALLMVLHTALHLQRETQGVFHVGVGNSLVAWGVLPNTHRRAHAPSTIPDDPSPCFEVTDVAARRTHDRRLDLGGIAKGYAVDAAAAAIERVMGEAACGWVNIGGDLRVFGPQPPGPVMVRLPQGDASTLWPCQRVRPAMATSSVRCVEDVSAFVDTRSQCPWLRACTVVAQAPLCMLADAFTKIGALMEPSQANDLATRYDVALAVVP